MMFGFGHCSVDVVIMNVTGHEVDVWAFLEGIKATGCVLLLDFFQCR